MRKVLDASSKEEISLQEEVEILELYLSLEKLRFGNDFVYNIFIDNDIDAYNTAIPPLLLQPFVENALKHGLLHKADEKTLHIAFYKKMDTLCCSIKDNGVGRKRSEEIKNRQKEKYESFSTEAMQKRLELLNHTHYQKISLQINDLYDQQQAAGTEIILQINLLFLSEGILIKCTKFGVVIFGLNEAKNADIAEL